MKLNKAADNTAQPVADSPFRELFYLFSSVKSPQNFYETIG
jgi:hypothetical protein